MLYFSIKKPKCREPVLIKGCILSYLVSLEQNTHVLIGYLCVNYCDSQLKSTLLLLLIIIWCFRIHHLTCLLKRDYYISHSNFVLLLCINKICYFARYFARVYVVKKRMLIKSLPKKMPKPCLKWASYFISFFWLLLRLI